jgi:phosphomannomutase/phosphoglucomutase
MKLIFSALAVFVVLMVFSAGTGVSWLSSSSLEAAKRESVKSLATGLAYSISSQMRLFEQTVEQIAVDEDVVLAVTSADPALMEKAAGKMQKFLPVALKLRVLPASVNAVDEREVPAMGFADLTMVKKTLTEKQMSIIQGEGDNRHLAVTAPVKQGNQVIGVVLASLKYEFLTEILAKAPIHGNYIEIRQDAVVLGSGGDSTRKENAQDKIAIAGSPWQIAYATAGVSFSNLGETTGFVIVLAILTCAALFAAYYYISGLLKKDQNTVLEAVKNLMTGKELSNYEVKLTEMQVIISTLVQFKRILDNKGGASSSSTATTENTEPSKKITFDDELFAEAQESVEAKKSTSSLLKKKN